MKDNTIQDKIESKNDNKAYSKICNEKYVLISFQSSHHAIRGEKVAETAIANFDCTLNENTGDKVTRLIPLPPKISAGCGLVLQLPFALLQVVLEVFKSEAIAFEDIFIVESDKTYRKLSQKRDNNEKLNIS